MKYETNIMAKKTINLMPSSIEILKEMGEQIKLARLRRNISIQLVADRANIARSTVWKVEKGDPTVSIGTYTAVLHALHGMDKDLLLVAKDDKLGRQMQDMGLLVRKRAK